MKDCNRTASDKHLKGDARRDYMSQCLRNDGGNELTAQQQRMKTCNQRASNKDLKGDKRQDFMSECLSADKDDRRTSAAGGRR